MKLFTFQFSTQYNTSQKSLAVVYKEMHTFRVFANDTAEAVESIKRSEEFGFILKNCTEEDRANIEAGLKSPIRIIEKSTVIHYDFDLVNA